MEQLRAELRELAALAGEGIFDAVHVRSLIIDTRHVKCSSSPTEIDMPILSY